jgi:hypothetical protein
MDCLDICVLCITVESLCHCWSTRTRRNWLLSAVASTRTWQVRIFQMSSVSSTPTPRFADKLWLVRLALRSLSGNASQDTERGQTSASRVILRITGSFSNSRALAEPGGKLASYVRRVLPDQSQLAHPRGWHVEATGLVQAWIIVIAPVSLFYQFTCACVEDAGVSMHPS